MIPLYRSLLLFILLKCYFPEMNLFPGWANASAISEDNLCGPLSHIIVREGGEAILPIHKSRTGTFTWRFDTGNFFESFAKTEAGGKIWDIKDQFRGRLSSTENGSLIITNVTMNERNQYMEWADKGSCVQAFHLIIYKPLEAEDILIRHNITGKEMCNITLTCAVTQPQVTVSWDETNRTEVEGDTLHLYNVNSNVTYSCTAQNPISRASRTINPWDLCYKGAEPEELSPPTVVPLFGIALDTIDVKTGQGSLPLPPGNV
ncbi:SLAM family member 9-like [Xenopus laevis]|uniref:SLAM family member 9-like n=1 Tax=Xenopus laevis TaxID=8355 RepID=A0A8J1LJ10_XENLA|nr:SLAM family member 9-like [Xenopus laevis]